MLTIGFAPSPAAGTLVVAAAAEPLAVPLELPVELPVEPVEEVEVELVEFKAKDWYASNVLLPFVGLSIISTILTNTSDGEREDIRIDSKDHTLSTMSRLAAMGPNGLCVIDHNREDGDSVCDGHEAGAEAGDV